MDKISKYCDALMESAWLLALIVTPLFFMVEAFRVSDGSKIFVFRSFVWLALAAWLIKGLALAGPGFQNIQWRRSANRINILKLFRDQPVLIPTAGLLFVYLISTMFSISPRTSLMGSYTRLEGVVTLVTYLIFFVLLVFNLRTREQIDRMAAVLATVCFSIDGYALLQHFHMDPFYWPEVEASSRVMSTLGHPIFAGAFLSMATFIILPRAILAIQAFLLSSQPDPRSAKGLPTRRTADSRTAIVPVLARPINRRVPGLNDLIQALVYSLVCILNLASIWLTISRGPLLGLFSGMACFLVLFLLKWRLKRILHITLATGAVLFTLLVVLNIPSGPLQSLRDKPGIGPLGHLLDAETGTGQARILIWQGMAQLTGPHAPLSFPDQTIDSMNPIRWLVGYGPDVLNMAYEGFYNPESYVLEAPNILYDRSHNQFWDILSFYGLLGLLAEYGLFLSLFYVALQQLVLINTGQEQKLYWLLSIGGGLLGFLLPLLISKPAYIGISAHLGLLAGLVGIMIRAIFQPRDSIPASHHPALIIIIGLLAALISNYVELSTGIMTVTSSLLFWVCSATLLSIGQNKIQELEATTGSSNAQLSIQNELRQVGINSTILCLLLVTIGTRFIENFQNSGDAGTVLTDALTTISNPTRQSSLGILALLIGSLFVGALLLQTGTPRGQAPNWKNMLASSGFALIVSVIILLIRASQFAGLGQANSNGGDTLALISEWNGLTATVFFALILFLVLMAYFLAFTQFTAINRRAIALGRTNSWALFSWAVLALFCACAAILSVVTLNLRPLQADILYAKTWSKTNARDFGAAALIFDQLIVMAPTEPDYQRFADKLYIGMISNTANDNEKERYYTAGIEHVKTANALEPLLVSNTMALAEFYRLGGEITRDPALRDVRFLLANTYYAAALKIKPSRVDYWLGWASLCASKGDIACATDKIDSALAANSKAESIYQFTGDLFSVYASSITEPDARTQAFTTALKAYQTEADLLTNKNANPVLAFLGMGNVYENLKQVDQARAAYLQAVQFGNDSPNSPISWQVYQRIAVLSSELKDPLMQREYLQKAIASAPDDQKAALNDQLNKLTP